ncbi:hypothetical protein NGI46_10940 [Peribacillus butanolivorans]|uniref:hypothetical protein n=1 Tax=Peribacillus butanolivorans TaxID=421767 RepID=UPI00207CFA8B|nr:hypothetical protein [Peribacillus butanolivorans]MCO0597981.1 hypothetical protein [Peribacillus butanolivorans]
MKIKEVLDELPMPGNTVAKIAKYKAKIGEKRLKEALHNAGCEYRTKILKAGFMQVKENNPFNNPCLSLLTYRLVYLM